MAFIAKKEQPNIESDENSILKNESGYTGGLDDEAKLRSPSIFKPKFPKAKQSSAIEIVSSDSDTSPIKPKSKASRSIKDEYPNKTKSMDEFDLMVSGYCKKASAISMNLELDLESDSQYLKATKKLQENLAKISPTKSAATSKIGKFQYKVPKATSMLAALDVPLKEPINLNLTPNINTDDDPFETKYEKPSSSTPILVTNTHKRSTKDTKGEQSIFRTSSPAPSDINGPTKTTLDEHNRSNNQHISPISKTSIKPISTSTFKSNPANVERPEKKKPKVTFDPDLDDYMVDVLNSPCFKTNGLSQPSLKENCTSLKEIQNSLLEKYYDIFSQLPVEFFSSIDGFRLDAYSKLKSLIENVKSKIKVNEKALKNVTTSSTIGSRKSCLETTTASNGVSDTRFKANQISRDISNSSFFDEPERDCVDSTLPPVPSLSTPSQSSAFVFKKPMFGTMPGTSATAAAETINPSQENEDDDIESILNNIQEAELIDRGRANQTNLSSIDLITPESSFRRPEPRVTFSAHETSLRNTQFIENVETQIDDDGWQVYDASQFEDNNDIISIADVSEAFPSTSNNQRYSTNNDQSLYRSVDAVGSSQASNASSNLPKSQNSLGNFHSGVHNDGLTGVFDGMNYPHSQEMAELFRTKFGLQSFRPNQLQVINATLLGNDCFVLMPTGGGKSLCYQLPALLTNGVTIVVSPLKSLILDQVNKLSSLDIEAAHLSGNISYAEEQRIYYDLQSPRPKMKLLYVTPEKISSSGRFQNVLSGLHAMKQLARFVIDEAHCVSAWGHDFRPDYKKLSVLREQFPSIPIMALTATANPRVRVDVIKQLRLKSDTKWFLCSFNRPNLKYIVRPKQGVATKQEIIDLIKKKYPRASGIVYCLAKKDCDQLAAEMKSAGISAKSYHAGLSDSQRESTQKDWIADKTKVVCATIAFGMGIDKPDVRYVIHHSIPKSIEGYYQEAGRAGRDGDFSTCILYYNYSDMLRFRKMMDFDSSIPFEAKKVHVNNLFRMVDYCENVTDCRRSQQLNYFAEHFTREQCLENRATACDNCLMQGEYKTMDVTDDCIAVAKSVRDLCSGRNRFTLLHLVEIFKGSEQKKIIENNHHKTPYHGRLKAWDRIDIQRLMHKLVIEDYLKEDLIFSNDIPQAYIKIGTKIEKLMNREVRVNFSVKTNKAGKKNLQVDVGVEQKLDSQSATQLKELQERCYNNLLDTCRKLAADLNVTLASVMNMQALKAMAQRLPETEAEMLALPHVTKANFEKYGKHLLDITQNFAAEKIVLMLDAAEAAADNGEDDSEGSSDEDGTDWARLANEASSSGASGVKRRRSWGSAKRGAKRYRKGRTKSRARTKTTSTRGGGVRKTVAKSASRGGRSGGSSFGLLPLLGNR